MSELKQINDILLKHWRDVPSDSLFGGKTGASVISRFVINDKFKDEEYPDLWSLLILDNNRIDIEIWKVWIVATLIKNNRIGLPESFSFERVVNEAIYRSRRWCYCSPIKITRDMPLYSFGIVGLKALQILDGIPFYSLFEWEVLFMRDCEYFLTHSIPHIYDNTQIKASILHSTLRFMQLAEKQGIFPWKARQLKDYILSMPFDRETSQPIDNYILDFLKGQIKEKYSWSYDNLGYLGTISFLYDMPELFTNAYRPLDLTTVHVNNLVGIGLGFLSNEINHVTHE